MACLPARIKPAVVADTVVTIAVCAVAVVTGIVVDDGALGLARTAVVSAALIFVMLLVFLAADDGSADIDAAVVAATLRQMVPWSMR